MALKVSKLTITPHLITIKCPSSLIFLSLSYDCGEVFVNGIQKISGLLVSYDCGEVFVNGIQKISGLLVSYDCGEVFVNGIQKISGLLVSYDCGEVFVNGIQKISGLLLFSLYNTGFMVYGLWCLMALSTIFYISVILVEETRVPRENH